MSAQAQTGFDRVREVGRRRGGLAVIVAALALALGAGVALGLPSVYRATATVLVGPEENAPDGAAPAGLESRLHVVKEEILSRAHAAGLVRRFGLYPALQGQGAPELVLEQFRRDVEVQLREAQEPGGRGRTVAVAVGYRGPDPAVVATVTNALADAYLAWDARLRASAAAALEAQVAQVRAQVDAQEQRLGEFRSRHAGDLVPHGDTTLATLERLNGQLRAASESRLRALERRSALFRELGEAAPKAPDDPDATASRLAKLNQELADLRQRFTDKYPDVQRMKTEIATLERQAAESRRRARPEPQAALAPRAASLQEALRDTDSEIDGLRVEEASLRRQVEGARRQVGTAPRGGGAATAQSLLELTRDYETTKSVYASLLRRYEEARLAAADGRQALQMRILEPAVPPSIPAAPNRLRLLLVALAVSLGAGLAAALLAEHADGSFHSVEDVRGFTRVPVFGIPTLLTRDDQRRRRRRRQWAVAAVILGVACLGQVSYRLARGSQPRVSASGGRS
jgi:polysaccharide chain length determinant protein (PEP-CTERM system associated)